MSRLAAAAARVIKRPGAFALHTLKAFRANQGLLLAGAVAYCALTPIVPLLILTVIALTHAMSAIFIHRVAIRRRHGQPLLRNRSAVRRGLAALWLRPGRLGARAGGSRFRAPAHRVRLPARIWRSPCAAA